MSETGEEGSLFPFTSTSQVKWGLNVCKNWPLFIMNAKLVSSHDEDLSVLKDIVLANKRNKVKLQCTVL